MDETAPDERIALTRAIMHILDSWGLTAQDQLSVLALPPGTPTRALRKYREHTPFPQTEALAERLEHIVGIADALRTTYPLNPAMGLLWLKQPLARFDQRAPLLLIVQEGLSGLKHVRAHLDCFYAWQGAAG